MQIGRSNGVFPASLYVALCLALLALVRPESLHEVQRRLHGASSTTVRLFLAQELQAAGTESEELITIADRERTGRMLRRLEERAAKGLQARTDGPADPGSRPSAERLHGIVCRVLDRRGARGLESELVLDRLRVELGDVERFVTVDGTLVGSLQDLGVPQIDERGRPDPLAGHARVTLLHHQPVGEEPRRVPAYVQIDDTDLSFLVEPAGDGAEFPLCCTLWSDPYLAAANAGLLGAKAYTSDASLYDGEDGVPAGLRIGRIRVFGYQRGSEIVSVKQFVEPQYDASSLVTVTLWSSSPSVAARTGLEDAFLRGFTAEPVSMLRYRTPTSSGRRLLAATTSAVDRPLPLGAAVVHGLRVVGRIRTEGNGFGVVSAFGEPGYRQTFVFVPIHDSREVLEFVATVEFRDGDRVRLRLPPDLEPLTAGDLFTGGDGPHFPSGLWIGPVLGSKPGVADVRHIAIDALDRRARVLIRRAPEGRT